MTTPREILDQEDEASGTQVLVRIGRAVVGLFRRPKTVPSVDTSAHDTIATLQASLDRGARTNRKDPA